MAKWQETDVAVKVITHMQKLSPLREVHGQGQNSMQPCCALGKHANTQAAGQAEGLGNQHMGIDLQGQCYPVGNKLVALKVKNPVSISKLVSFYRQAISVCFIRIALLGLVSYSQEAQPGVNQVHKRHS